jgi:hypothetical protein
MDSSLPAVRRLFLSRRARRFIAVALSFALAGCASGTLADRGYKVVSVTYQYTDQNRLECEWRAVLTAQDECYTGGYEYAQPAGPPQIISDGGMASELRATRFFYCIGLRGEG